MASTRPDTLASTHGDAHRDALMDGRGNTPGTRRTDASDDPMADDDSLDASLRDEFPIADEMDDAEAFFENVPDAVLFLPFRDGRPLWR